MNVLRTCRLSSSCLDCVQMRRADLQPDRYTYNALLRAVVTTRNLEDTQRVVSVSHEAFRSGAMC